MNARRIGWVLVAVLAAAACSDGSGDASYLTQTAAACPAVDALTGQRFAKPLPAEFRPVSAVQCTFRHAGPQSTGSPSYGLVWVTALRSTGPFDDLVRALLLPPYEVDGEVACPAILVMPVLLAHGWRLPAADSGGSVVPRPAGARPDAVVTVG
jgi:hypothetical protein